MRAPFEDKRIKKKKKKKISEVIELHRYMFDDSVRGPVV